MAPQVAQGHAPTDRWVSPGGARYDRSAVPRHPAVRATWVTCGGAAHSESAYTVARPYTSVTVELTAGGQCHIGVRPAGELMAGAPTSGTLVGVELHPWVGPRVAEHTVASLDVDRLAEVLAHGNARGAAQLLTDAASATDILPDPTTVEIVRSLLSTPPTQRRDHTCSERTTRRLVAGATGLTPMRLRRTARAGVAREMIATADLPLAQIAVAAGFSDQAHMTHEFTTLCGYTPGQWRRHTAAWVLAATDPVNGPGDTLSSGRCARTRRPRRPGE